MNINHERVEALANYFKEDTQRMERLLAMPVEEAAVLINADGFDFTAEELVAIAEEVEKVAGAQAGELSAEDLDDVSGGCDPVTLASLLVLCTIVYVAATAVKIWLKCSSRKRR